MPRRDINEIHAWVEREHPSAAARAVARAFLDELDDRPWCAPSIPIAELSNQPEHEFRTAVLEVEGERGVALGWMHFSASGDVDLIAITNR